MQCAVVWSRGALTAAVVAACSRPATSPMMPGDLPGQETCSERQVVQESEQWAPSSPAVDLATVPDVIPALSPVPENDNPYLGSSGVAPVATRSGHSLLAVDARERPYKVLVPLEYTRNCKAYASTIRICVTEDGNVSSMDILRGSIPVIDQQLPVVVPRWRYRPYLVAGRPTPFCYILRYVVH